MRGNWDSAEPAVHAPNQQQQQTIVEEQSHPLHSPTTPAWGSIGDRIVKEEITAAEDKNNDSGVSPDHYTNNSGSPRSRRSSSTANCSLSPGSATSQDSSTMQCTTFEYNSQFIYKTCDSPEEFSQRDAMEEHDRANQSVGGASNTTMKPSADDEDVDLAQETLQCPVCVFATSNRSKFTEHVTGHYTSKRGDSPDFVKTVLSQLPPLGSFQDESNDASPVKGERSEHECEETDEPGLRVPRVNSQGKVKTFRCKQCSFVAITKLEFWEHSRCHIKAEKLLTCPKCPFVTEYKHHLEYHLRNHFGSKPFKCDKCSYSCVNKSMLNSHLKSHSNVYQYRCADCSYATKYCHSLKLHLRKYSHQPAMVLNADGSPNPLPIIDVYGTRRGPKQKSCVKTQDDLQQHNTGSGNNAITTTGNAQTNLQTLSSSAIAPQVASPIAAHHAAVPVATINGFSDHSKANSAGNMSQNPSLLTFPYSHLFAAFPLSSHFLTCENANMQRLDQADSNPLLDYVRAINAEDRTSEDLVQDLSVTYFGASNADKCDASTDTKSITGDESLILFHKTQTDVERERESESKNAPLDLSKSETTIANKLGVNQRASAGNLSKVTGTSRRKGKAVKLERRVIEEDTDEEVQNETEESFKPPASSSPDAKNAKQEIKDSTGVGNEFTCQYCEIAFGNVVMYTVHMGYHGYKDPYTCNMCGHECTDKVSFFLHIARSKHS